MSQRAFDDFQGMLDDFKAEPGCVPADKLQLFAALSYQPPSDIPGGLAQLTEALQIDPDEIQTQYNGFLANMAKQRERPSSGVIPRPIRSGAFQNRSDWGNAIRFVDKFFDRIRFCPDTNRWLIWNGRHWAVDETGEIMQYAGATVRDIYKEAANLSDPAERKAHAQFALRSESERGLKAMVSLARYENGIPVRRSCLDAHPLKLNVNNGVIDMEKGELSEHKQDLFFTKILPWNVDTDMKTPRWDQFLEEITGGDRGLINYLQQIAGYCLTASIREQCFFIFWGDGRNGKSTFIKILLELLGPWAAQTPAETFITRKGASNHNDLARLFDKRLVAAIETEEGGKLAEGLIKGMAGNDRIAARQLYQEFFEYDPTFKIVLTTNHKPRIKGTDFAIWRRIRLVPFTWKIPDDKVDPDLFEKLKSEMPGILAWAVTGVFEWQKAGKLVSPEKVKVAVDEYQKDQDVVRRFVDDCCEMGNVEFQESGKILFNAYKSWAIQNGEYVISANKFGRRLIELGFEKIHTMFGNTYKNIKLISTEEHEFEENDGRF